MKENASVVGLAAAIEALRRELTEALEAGERERVRFTLEPIEITVEVAVTKNANGKIGWTILEAGADYQNVTTQTLVLRLKPLVDGADGVFAAPEVYPDKE